MWNNKTSVHSDQRVFSANIDTKTASRIITSFALVYGGDVLRLYKSGERYQGQSEKQTPYIKNKVTEPINE